MAGKKNQGYDPKKLAAKFLKWGYELKIKNGSKTLIKKVLHWWREGFYLWKGGLYKMITEKTMELSVTRFIQGSPVKSTPSCVKSVMLNLKTLTELDNETQPNSWINGTEGPQVLVVQNGTIVLGDTNPPKVLAHTPNYFTLVKLPIAYDVNAECPKWLQFLDEIMEGDQEMIRLLKQWVGYLLTPTLKEHRFMICVGEGANGKGVFFEVIQAMLGSENCSSIPLSRFRDRFSLSSTYGKLLNATSEGIHEIQPGSEAVLKEHTSGDMMAFERKHRDVFNAKPTAKLMFATNELPTFRDRTQGIWRRLLLVPFDKTIPEEQQDKGLAEALKGELSGIFNWAYDGMIDLEKNGFVIPAKSREAMEQYRHDVNPAKVFLEENYSFRTKSAGSQCQAVYDHYKDWCEKNGYKPLNSANFGKEVKRVFPGVDKKRLGSKRLRTNFYKGLTKGVTGVIGIVFLLLC